MNVDRSVKNKKGFSLVEMLVVVAIFTLVVFIAVGAVTRMFGLNQKVRSVSVVLNNVATGMEIMTSQLRYGSDYECLPSDGCDSISFIDYEDREVTYFLQDETIWRAVDGGSARELSDPGVNISELRFRVFDDVLVLMVVKGDFMVGRERTELGIQTAVSKRSR